MAAAAAGGWRGGVQGGPATGAAGLGTLRCMQSELRRSGPTLLQSWGREAGSLLDAGAWRVCAQLSLAIEFSSSGLLEPIEAEGKPSMACRRQQWAGRTCKLNSRQLRLVSIC